MAVATDLVGVDLLRGKKGLGFNIRGGTDMQHIPGETGIFIAKIRQGGAANEDGRLQEGDQIVELNGVSMRDLSHKEAVDLFVKAGPKVSLKVFPGAERAIYARIAASQRDERLVALYPFLIGLPVVCAGLYISFRYFKGQSLVPDSLQALWASVASSMDSD